MIVSYKKGLVNPNKVVIPLDFKPDADKLKELSEYMKLSGMQNKPIIKEDFTIVAGKRRVLAARLLGLVEIEVQIIENSTSLETCRIISLHENLGRENLAWYDQ